VVDPEAEIIAVGAVVLLLITTLALAVQPFVLLVTVTVYVPAAFTDRLAVVAPVLHK
jgi:hypothetical protein